jgi:hypothetical protein
VRPRDDISRIIKSVKDIKWVSKTAAFNKIMQEVLNLTPSTHAHLTYGYRQRQQKDIKRTQKYHRNMAKTVLNHNNKIQEQRKINL